MFSLVLLIPNPGNSAFYEPRTIYGKTFDICEDICKKAYTKR